MVISVHMVNLDFFVMNMNIKKFSNDNPIVNLAHLCFLLALAHTSALSIRKLMGKVREKVKEKERVRESKSREKVESPK